MARNIEAKFAGADLTTVAERARLAGAVDSGVLVQKDTFFGSGQSRLKLREQAGQSGAQLIAYRRADERAARASDYLIYETADPVGLTAALGLALGAGIVVEKRRHLFLWRNTRIHLDRVAGLGDFVELETVLGDGRTDAQGVDEFLQVQSALELRRDDIVPAAYADLLAKQV